MDKEELLKQIPRESMPVQVLVTLSGLAGSEV